MLKPIGAALAGLAVGALLGMAVGVAIAFLHLKIRPPVFPGLSLTPSISGLLLGSVAGLLVGMAIAFIRRATGANG